MIVNKARALAALVVLGGIAATPALAADGKALFADKGCTACHGEDAKTPLEAGYPRLAGQNATYMVNQMKDIKAGKRANGLSPDTMKPILEEVTEEEMQALADYLAGLGPIAGKGDAAHPGKKLYMTKTCIACHGKDGAKPIMKTYPFLAGQDKDYLIRQATDIKTSTRTNGLTNSMQPVMHLVTDEELAQIADFLANVK
ncbi:c-type cytochrome [Magnetospirillum sp. 64-120]|uniref:c-type cytochrome n=1 Tax=Magnetospirillum sp. 64-120 TaxID=1895778 RepID=UPI00092B6973|nr:c-type cytochrome [Magnetospirillum sp. 64-120]OJX72172.1 MAG: cytochrome C4 precursor [Magnetospirillum sp. 64-120]